MPIFMMPVLFQLPTICSKALACELVSSELYITYPNCFFLLLNIVAVHIFSLAGICMRWLSTSCQATLPMKGSGPQKTFSMGLGLMATFCHCCKRLIGIENVILMLILLYIYI